VTGVIHQSTPSTGVRLFEIDCPPANAVCHAARASLAEAFASAETDLDTRAVVITGRGAGFCAGDDLREAAARGADALGSLAQFGQLLDQIEALRVPVIAAINGHCIGGGLELALCCDIRIASPAARFIAAGVNVGLMASVYRLPRIVGAAQAKSMILTGNAVDAASALDTGLVTAVHATDALLPAALALAAHIATRAPLSVEASKQMINQAFDLSPDEARNAIAAHAVKLVASRDHAEGAAAFAARRKPDFTRS
jgi:enoyl-CoA hydratase